MKKNKLIYVLLVSCFFSIVFPKLAFADDESNNLGYTVSAIRNAKQIDPDKSYFYIQTTPSEEEELKVKVKSTQEEEVKVNVYVVDAFTGDKGTIEYTKDPKLLDKTLTNSITTMATVETPTITVGNYEEKEAIIKLTPPAESYEGIKMGALVFELDTGESEETVGNRFSYRLGLFTSESGDDYKNSKSLNLIEVKSSIKRGKKMVLATLQNPEPKILMNLELKATIQEKGKTDILKQEKVSNYTLAPNSQFDFEMDWGTNQIKPGTFILKMTGNNGENDWSFEKEFTISGEQAKKMNEESGFKIITPTWIKITTILCLAWLIVGIIYLVVRRKKMEADWKNLKKRRKKKRKKKEGS